MVVLILHLLTFIISKKIYIRRFMHEVAIDLYDDPYKYSFQRLLYSVSCLYPTASSTGLLMLNDSLDFMSAISDIYQLERSKGMISLDPRTTSTSEHLCHQLLTTGGYPIIYFNKNKIPGRTTSNVKFSIRNTSSSDRYRPEMEDVGGKKVPRKSGLSNIRPSDMRLFMKTFCVNLALCKKLNYVKKLSTHEKSYTYLLLEMSTGSSSLCMKKYTQPEFDTTDTSKIVEPSEKYIDTELITTACEGSEFIRSFTEGVDSSNLVYCRSILKNVEVKKLEDSVTAESEEMKELLNINKSRETYQIKNNFKTLYEALHVTYRESDKKTFADATVAVGGYYDEIDANEKKLELKLLEEIIEKLEPTNSTLIHLLIKCTNERYYSTEGGIIPESHEASGDEEASTADVDQDKPVEPEEPTVPKDSKTKPPSKPDDKDTGKKPKHKK